MIYYLIDTNILLDYPQFINNFKVDNDNQILILTDILKELDGLKLNINSETAFKARRAAVVILRNLNKISFDNSLENEKISVDDKIIKVAEKHNDEIVIITNDLYLRIKATTRKVVTYGYDNDTDYTGIYYYDVELDEVLYSKELEEVLEGNKKLPLKENQYLIARDKNNNNNVIAIYINKDNKLLNLSWNNVVAYNIENKWIGTIKPKNPEQKCLFYSLSNEQNTIIYAGGTFGTGKSFIINNYALQQLERGKIRKIVYVPNNAYTANTIDLGALPGVLLDKIVGQIGPLIDLVGIDEINRLIQREMLEVVPISFIRGRSFTDSIIIVNEAQNLTEDHIKLLIARVGSGSRIFFDGDYKQTDSAIFKNKNGLKLLLNLADSEKYASLFSTVKLTKTERSITAQSVDFLDSIEGNI